jgi:glyoxylate/hydroxypyruvate reductase A
VAIAGAHGKTILFHSPLSDRSWPGALQAALPEFTVHTQPEDVDPADVVAAVVWRYPPGMLARFANLRLIQVLGAGVDHLWSDDRLPRTVPIARLVDPGLTARMAEYVLAHALALHRRAPELRRAQHERAWRYLHPTPPEQTCVGMLGLGVLGRSCATALAKIGFTVMGWSRTPKLGLDMATYAGSSGLAEFKQRADIIVLLLPLTRETGNFIDAAFLADVRPGAALINVGRGQLIVDDDLIAALDAGTLRHAVLDVFRTEPLPADHAFWGHPGITITPHNSSATNPATAVDQVVENVRRALAGRAPLHPVDPAIGY